MTTSSTRKLEYREVYLRSDHWQSMRQLALKDAEHRCAVCNSTKNLDVHHRTYERLGSEQLTDLLVMCRCCHSIFHEHRRLARPPKAKVQHRAKVVGLRAEVQTPTTAMRQSAEKRQRVMAALQQGGPGTTAEIAARTGMRKTVVGGVLSRMSSDGLVRRKGSKKPWALRPTGHMRPLVAAASPAPGLEAVQHEPFNRPAPRDWREERALPRKGHS